MGPVKDFVRDVWKIAAACASRGFSPFPGGRPDRRQSVRHGDIPRVAPRRLFAGLATGLRFVVRAYLPELVTSSASSADTDGGVGSGATATIEAREPGQRGGAVDIVLPEDDGLRRQAYGGSRRGPRQGPGKTREGGGRG